MFRSVFPMPAAPYVTRHPTPTPTTATATATTTQSNPPASPQIGTHQPRTTAGSMTEDTRLVMPSCSLAP